MPKYDYNVACSTSVVLNYQLYTKIIQEVKGVKLCPGPTLHQMNQ